MDKTIFRNFADVSFVLCFFGTLTVNISDSKVPDYYVSYVLKTDNDENMVIIITSNSCPYSPIYFITVKHFFLVERAKIFRTV